MIPAIYFYDVVKVAHIASIVLAFGVTFAYPIIMPLFKNRHPASMPALHEVQGKLGQYLIGPVGVLALITGAYLANDRDLFGETWVVVPLLILLVILGMGGFYLGPTEKRLHALSERDIGASGQLSAQYEALYDQFFIVARTVPALVLVAIFFMAAKPFA